jgi:hypothetical protein
MVAGEPHRALSALTASEETGAQRTRFLGRRRLHGTIKWCRGTTGSGLPSTRTSDRSSPGAAGRKSCSCRATMASTAGAGYPPCTGAGVWSGLGDAGEFLECVKYLLKCRCCTCAYAVMFFFISTNACRSYSINYKVSPRLCDIQPQSTTQVRVCHSQSSSSFSAIAHSISYPHHPILPPRV